MPHLKAKKYKNWETNQINIFDVVCVFSMNKFYSFNLGCVVNPKPTFIQNYENHSKDKK